MDISTDEIHLWFALDEEIQDLQLLSQYHNILDSEERKQQQRFFFEKHRHQYLVARALVRSVLSLYVNNIHPAEWYFTKNKYGKPSTSNPLTTPLKFNLSHTEKMVVLAIAKHHDLGVDVEWVHRNRTNMDIAERYFSPVEVDQLFSLRPVHQRRRFIDLWTLKEAYIKACGVGLSMPLDHFTFLFSNEDQLSISFHPQRDNDSVNWRFWQLQPNENHIVSLAIRSQNPGESYSLVMREIVPMHHVREVNYPVVKRSN